MFDELPFLGAGLSYQSDRHAEFVEYRSGIDFLEIPTDVFLGKLPDWTDRLMELKQNFTTLAHGIYMSLGDASGAHGEYRDRLVPYIEMLGPVLFSDHIDMGNVPSDELGKNFHGMQVPFTREQATVFQRNMRFFQDRIPLPLLLENVAYDFLIPMPGSLPEPLFLREIFEGTDCGLLLDITNVQINALNFGFDPYEWLEQAPLERAVQIHVAGGEILTEGDFAGRWGDTHSQGVPDEVWKMLEYVVARAPVKGVILERDQRPPPMAELMQELEIARKILGTANAECDVAARRPSLTPRLTSTTAESE